MKRKAKSSDISSYFKKNNSAGGESTGEEKGMQMPSGAEEEIESEKEDEAEGHKDDESAQPALYSEVSDEEEHQTEEQSQSEARQDSTTTGLPPVPGPKGKIMTMWP